MPGFCNAATAVRVSPDRCERLQSHSSNIYLASGLSHLEICTFLHSEITWLGKRQCHRVCINSNGPRNEKLKHFLYFMKGFIGTCHSVLPGTVSRSSHNPLRKHRIEDLEFSVFGNVLVLATLGLSRYTQYSRTGIFFVFYERFYRHLRLRCA